MTPGKTIIADNIARSAMYGGAIASRGPRYCPSVEDKIVKFPLAERHQIFLEPEGHDTAELYVNGMSTSLPAEVQLEVLRTIPGLEQVRMTRAGYAIEYDFFPPTQLDASLQVKAIPGLYFAGQINGTTGYEEAAGQGVVAGLNAARAALGQCSGLPRSGDVVHRRPRRRSRTARCRRALSPLHLPLGVPPDRSAGQCVATSRADR